MPHPALEVALSLRVLGSSSVPPHLARWRRQVEPRLPPQARGAWLSGRGHEVLPDLLDSVTAALDRDAPPPWDVPVPPSGRGGRSAVPDAGSPGAPGEPGEPVRAALRAYFETAIAPLWPHLATGVEGDPPARTPHAPRAGYEGLLAALGRDVAWQPPLLRIPCCGERTLDLAGRGLLLIPSYFCWGKPVIVRDAGGTTPVLAYPMRADAPAWAAGTGQPGEPADRSLVALLGRTRAAVLRSVRTGCNTTELSRRAGVSLSTASEHAGVLRGAGLVVSSRKRNEMVHHLTPLGAALLGPDTLRGSGGG
jgi:DNA-binding transcriptional ArsR family regulator